MSRNVFSKGGALMSQKTNFGSDANDEEDPLSGAANLLDVGLVFIVGLIMSLFYATNLQDLFNENSNFTIMKQSENGEMELIRKMGKKIEAVKITRSEAEGRGTRLGTAYQLEDGTMVYLPDDGK